MWISSLKIILPVIFVISIIYFGYQYIQNKNDKIEQLTTKNVELENTINQQNEFIKKQEQDIKNWIESNERLTRLYRQNSINLQELRNRLTDNDRNNRLLEERKGPNAVNNLNVDNKEVKCLLQQFNNEKCEE